MKPWNFFITWLGKCAQKSWELFESSFFCFKSFNKKYHAGTYICTSSIRVSIRTKECCNKNVRMLKVRYVLLRIIFEICLHHFLNEISVNMIFSKINFRNVYLIVQGIWLYNPIRCYGDFRHTSLDDDVRISFKMRLAWFALLVAYFIKNSVAQVLNSDFHYGYWYAICVIFTFSPGLFIFIFGPQQRRIVSGK